MMTPEQKSRAATTAKKIVTAAAKKPVDLIIRIKQVLKAIYRAVKSTVGLLIILGVYSVIGAFLFRYLEGDEETIEIEEYALNREGLLRNLTETLKRGDLDEANRQLIGYEQQLKHYFEHGLTVDKMKQGPTWTFMGSLVYCITVYTTIGYGHIAPNTDGGRVATIFYALIGIPLCLIILADLGKLITRAIKFAWAFVRRFYYTGNCKKLRKKAAAGQAKFIHRKGSDEAIINDDESDDDVYEIDDEFNLPVPIALAIVLAYLFGGTFMYLGWEDWGYLEALYFVFISVSTIGFGDVLPDDQTMFFFSMFYIFIGLSLISMTINVFIEFFDTLISNMKTKAGNFAKNRFGIDFDKIANEGGSEHKTTDADEVELADDRSRSRSVSIEAEQTPDEPRSKNTPDTATPSTPDRSRDGSRDESKSRSVSIEAKHTPGPADEPRSQNSPETPSTRDRSRDGSRDESKSRSVSIEAEHTPGPGDEPRSEGTPETPSSRDGTRDESRSRSVSIEAEHTPGPGDEPRSEDIPETRSTRDGTHDGSRSRSVSVEAEPPVDSDPTELDENVEQTGVRKRDRSDLSQSASSND